MTAYTVVGIYENGQRYAQHVDAADPVAAVAALCTGDPDCEHVAEQGWPCHEGDTCPTHEAGLEIAGVFEGELTAVA